MAGVVVRVLTRVDPLSAPVVAAEEEKEKKKNREM